MSQLQLNLDFDAGRVPGERDTLALRRDSRKYLDEFLARAGFEGEWNLRPFRCGVSLEKAARI